MAISIQYNLTGVGWSECIVEIDGHHVRLTASYLSDALADLLDAVLALARGTTKATASFTEEPGEYRWCFRRVSPDKLRILILWFNEMWNDCPDEEGKVIFEAECHFQIFAEAVLLASQRVLEAHGLEGYLEKWVEHEFPAKQQANLEAALR